MSDQNPGLYYLTRADVAAALSGLDPLAVAEGALRAHRDGRTVLPDEAYLGWQTPDGHSARSLALPGLVGGGADGGVSGGAGAAGPPTVGIKIINASLGNTARGVPRADGLLLLFDPETAHPVCLMDAALVSATRTAAVSALAIRTLAPRPIQTLGLVGAGRQAQAHLELLMESEPELASVRIHDARPEAARRFAADYAGARVTVTAVDDARSAVEGADAVVTATTATAGDGYLAPDWLAPDAVVSHVSLDDLLPETVLAAACLVVDDWNLISADPRRLFGRMIRAGQLIGPDAGSDPAAPGTPGARRVDGHLADYLPGGPRKAPGAGVVIVNPFGMAIQDVALAGAVAAAARDRGLGTYIER